MAVIVMNCVREIDIYAQDLEYVDHSITGICVARNITPTIIIDSAYRRQSVFVVVAVCSNLCETCL